ncbi:helix-turn-helix transcriptional regulator [Streptomyces sp. NPDC051207]|uniref:helix-turn-helix transcriptional regulator n=1 Tax=Streptomyces sp. NPDC051207 TaxID=3154641 RepID=UPI003427D0C3
MTAETTVRTAPRIHGRSTQRRAVAALSDRTATGGGVLVLTGEPGLGRTALVAHAAGSFTAGPVLQARPGPSAHREPYTAVRELIGEAAALAGTGPAPYGDPVDADSAAGALLGALRAAAAGRRLLVCVDDAHRWDGPSRAALARTAACLASTPGVGLLLTLAAHRAAGRDFAGLPTVGLDPLTPPQASALLEDATGGDVDPAVRAELLEEADGNPALLLALVRRLSPAELHGSRPLPRPTADPATLTGVAGHHLTDIPADAHDLLLTAAAALRESDDVTVDAGLLRRAAGRVPAWGAGGRALGGVSRGAGDAGFVGWGARGPGGGVGAVRERFGGWRPGDVSGAPGGGEKRGPGEPLDETGLAGRVVRRPGDGCGSVGGVAGSPGKSGGPVVGPGSAGQAVWRLGDGGGPVGKAAGSPGTSDGTGADSECTGRPVRRPGDGGVPGGGAVPVRPGVWPSEDGGVLGGGTVPEEPGAWPLRDGGVPGGGAVPVRPGVWPSGDGGVLGGGAAPVRPGAWHPDDVPDVLVAVDGGFRFAGDLIRRAVYAAAPPERRRAAHRALAAELDADGRALPALLHRAWATPGPAPRTAAELAAAAEESPAAPHLLRAVALTRAAELTPEGPDRAARYTAAAEHALLAGRPHRALRLLVPAQCGSAPAVTRGRAELVRGTAGLRDGHVADAHESLLLAAALLTPGAPDAAARATLAAADAAWAAGDMRGCLVALRGEGPGSAETGRPGAPTAGTPDLRPPTPGRNDAERALQPSVSQASDSERALLADYRLGMRAVLEARLDQALGPLRRVVAQSGADVRPQALLKSAAAGLLLGDVAAARRAGARALAAARNLGPAALVPQALEYLAYAELRAGRHAQARAHAEEGLRAAHRTGQRNTAAQHHAVLALAASIEGDTAAVDVHVSAALTTARRHGLAQAATLAEWAAARADLGRGRPLDAADRLGPLVRPGPRRGHFAVWMLAVPCYVEAAALAGRPDDARTVVAEFALWADFGADPPAPAQLARCHALLAGPDETDALYLRALARHEEADGDFERARTELLYGKWLRRRRRLREARDRLGAALVGFERCGARVWAEQARGELRANGAAPHGTGPGTARTTSYGTGAGPLARLTPQQLRIARYVAEGATNREVALRLAVSTRTVDYHLRNVFAAVGVRSRVELARLVEQAEKTRAQT